MSDSLPSLLYLSIAWILYFALHSLLASHICKAWARRRWPRLAPAYRLGYNFIATLLLIPPLWYWFTFEGPWLWRWNGLWAWLANGLALLAVLGFLHSSRSYDSLDFLGLRQLRHPATGTEAFTLSDWHRYVRHPWYFFGLVILWTRDMDAATLVSALCISGYLVLGSRWEERKLIKEYGESYRRYCAQVPGLVPLPGRHLTRVQARSLLEGNGIRSKSAVTWQD